jgi:hypothetical protein
MIVDAHLHLWQSDMRIVRKCRAQWQASRDLERLVLKADRGYVMTFTEPVAT